MQDDSSNQTTSSEEVRHTGVRHYYEILNTATPFAKYFALTLFVVLPFLGFWVGTQCSPYFYLEEGYALNALHNKDLYERVGGTTAPPLFAEVAHSGGLCEPGPCLSVLQIFTDGSYLFIDERGAANVGAPGTVDMTLLRAYLDATDLEAIRSKPFTGTCPTAYDGVEVTYTFEYPAPVALPSCTYVVDPDLPLFQVLDRHYQAASAR